MYSIDIKSLCNCSRTNLLFEKEILLIKFRYFQLDRYWAISDPIQYARQRTIRRVLAMIIIVWVLSAAISIPPIIAGILGSDELKTFNGLQQCELSNNKVYVIYSACGSFYIPAIIMTAVYAQVFLETRKRFRERARGSLVCF